MYGNRSVRREGPTYASGRVVARPGRVGAGLRAVVLATGLLWSAGAGAADVGSALRAGDWARAEAGAAEVADPVAMRLVRTVRALTPGASGAAFVLPVMEEAPAWPPVGGLARRYAEALAGERDDAVVAALCRRRAPGAAPALLRCAAVLPGGGEFAQRAWLIGVTDAAGETAFMRRWGSTIDGEAQWRRFERLAWSDNGAPGGTLARQAVRLDPAMRPAAEALLALRRGDAAGGDLFLHLPGALQGQPVVTLEYLRWLRRTDRDGAAARVWEERGAAAESAATAERRGAFFAERNGLARKLLRAGDDRAAFGVAAGQAEPTADGLFLAGWIALRRLDDPGTAATKFRALAAASEAAITQGRAQYWLGRALAAGGDTAAAAVAFRDGSRWATTYYGQLAALAGGESLPALMARVAALRDPAWDSERALEFAGSDLGRAATLLVAWGQAGRARAFLQAAAALQADPAGRSIVGRFAAALRMPDQAVAAARSAGRDGVMLPEVGWPEEVAIPAGSVERAVALGVIRQESSFDAGARSPAGAVGLMQLMPGTAAQVARQLGSAAGELTDPVANVRLGVTYLGAQIERFGALAPALAAYNAGPRRAQEWLQVNGNPADGVVDPIDWVELIPFEETRNYVQRIVESVTIYRAREDVALPHPVLGWAKGSGL